MSKKLHILPLWIFVTTKAQMEKTFALNQEWSDIDRVFDSEPYQMPRWCLQGIDGKFRVAALDQLYNLEDLLDNEKNHNSDPDKWDVVPSNPDYLNYSQMEFGLFGKKYIFLLDWRVVPDSFFHNRIFSDDDATFLNNAQPEVSWSNILHWFANEHTKLFNVDESKPVIRQFDFDPQYYLQFFIDFDDEGDYKLKCNGFVFPNQIPL